MVCDVLCCTPYSLALANSVLPMMDVAITDENNIGIPVHDGNRVVLLFLFRVAIRCNP